MLTWYLLDRRIFDCVRVVVVVDHFDIFHSFCFGRTAEVTVQVGFSRSFRAHSEVSRSVQLHACRKRRRNR